MQKVEVGTELTRLSNVAARKAHELAGSLGCGLSITLSANWMMPEKKKFRLGMNIRGGKVRRGFMGSSQCFLTSVLFPWQCLRMRLRPLPSFPAWPKGLHLLRWSLSLLSSLRVLATWIWAWGSRSSL